MTSASPVAASAMNSEVRGPVDHPDEQVAAGGVDAEPE